MTNSIQEPRRYIELDFARAIPLMGMPFVHFYEEFSGVFSAEGVGASWGDILLYLCMIGPSVFMMCLGMNLVFSRHSTPKELAKRGVITIGIYFLLNFLITLVPGGIAILCGYAEEKEGLVEYFFGSDILCFAGLTFLFFALVKKLHISSYVLLLLSVVLLSLNTLIGAPEISSGVLGSILGNVFYVNEYSSFPFFSWIIFPTVGYCMGHVILKLKDEAMNRRFYGRLFWGGIAGFAALSICFASYSLDPLLIASSPLNDYVTDLANVMLDLSISGALFGAAYFLSRWIPSEGLQKVASGFSKSILVFYCVQWIVVVWIWYGMVCLGLKWTEVFSEETFFAAAVGAAIVSYVVTYLIQRRRGAL